jgi:hypothetical protein
MIGKRRCEERCLAVACAAAALALGPPARGQEPGAITIDVSDCVELEKPGERLDCFERQLEGRRQSTPAADAGGSPSAAASAPAPTAPAPAPAPTREAARTAIPAPDAVETIREPRGRRARQEAAEAPGREIVAVVTELRETVPNTWTITLDNGQVWRQTPPKFYPLRPGIEVRLYPTGWGDSYRLTVAEQKSFIQVQRVR